MGARLRVFLSGEQDRTLFEMRTATTVPQRVKDRAAAVRLSSQGWYVEKIATHLNWNVDTVRETIHRWNQQGLGGLWDASRPGGQRRWQVADIEHIEQVLRDEPRTYNSQQLARKLKADRQVSLSADRLRRILKKRGSFGSVPDRAIAPNKTPNNAPASKPI
jgi:transposase